MIKIGMIERIVSAIVVILFLFVSILIITQYSLFVNKVSEISVILFGAYNAHIRAFTT